MVNAPKVSQVKLSLQDGLPLNDFQCNAKDKSTGMMNRFMKICLFLLLCLLALCGIANAGPGGLLRLGISLPADGRPVPEDFAERLNRLLRPEDILFVRGNAETVHFLRGIKQGRVAVLHQSLEGLKKDLGFFDSEKVKVDFLCYNPEAWKASLTPQSEKNDPVKAVVAARRIARDRGLGLIIVPDTSITLLAHGADMAPHADIFVIQFQRWQYLEGSDFEKLVSRNIWWVHTGNPDVPVFAKLSINPPVQEGRTDGTPYLTPGADELNARVQSLGRLVSGVVFQLDAGNGGFSRFLEFLELYRPPGR